MESPLLHRGSGKDGDVPGKGVGGDGHNLKLRLDVTVVFVLSPKAVQGDKCQYGK